MRWEALGLVLVSLFCATGAWGQTHRKVVASDDPYTYVPGQNLPDAYVQIQPGSVDNSGTVVFADSDGIYRWRAGQTKVAVQVGYQEKEVDDILGYTVDGVGGVVFSTFSTIQDKQVLALYYERGGSRKLLLSTEHPLGGAVTNYFSSITAAGSGQIAFLAQTIAHPEWSVYQVEGGQTRRVVIGGEATPEGTIGGFEAVEVNATGQLAFIAGANDAQSRGLYYLTAGGPRRATTLGGFDYVFRLNAAGGSLFSETSRISLCTPDGGREIFNSTSAIDANTTFAPNFEGLLNDAGQVAAVGFLHVDLGNNQAKDQPALVFNDGTNTVVVERHDYDTDGNGLHAFENLALNSYGQLAYLRETNSSHAVHFWNGQQVVRVIGEGDVLDGRTVASINLAHTAIAKAFYVGFHTYDGPRPLNDLGQITYKVKFTDGVEALYLYTPKPIAPVIASPLTGTAIRGRSFVLHIVARNLPTSFTATGLPAGLSLNKTTGVISGTPKVAGTFQIDITARNSAGEDRQTITLTLLDLTPFQGSYAGLIQTGGATAMGAVSLTLTSSGSVTGTLRLGAVSYVLKGLFDEVGNLTVFPSKTDPSLTLALHVDLAHPGASITGSCTAAGTTSPLIAELNPYKASSNPCPQAGSYTLQFPPSPADSVPKPTGSGYAVLKVTAAGSLTVTGALADGTPLKLVPGAVSASAHWSLYQSLVYKPRRGLLAGRLSFASTAATDLDGQLSWIAPAVPAGPYSAGFSEILEVAGSSYLAPPRSVRMLPFHNVIGNALITLRQGGLAQPFTAVGTLTTANLVAPVLAGPDQLKWRFNPSTALLSGTFVPPGTAKPVAVFGSVLQKQGLAFGFFLNAGNSGAAALSANPVFGTTIAAGGLNGDAHAPSITILNPAARSIFTGLSPITFNGRAGDAAGVRSVTCQVLYQGQISELLAATGTTEWSYTLTPTGLGAYIFYVKALDVNGNESALVSRSFTVK